MALKKRSEINVLIVDDEKGIRLGIAENLELDGFNVFTACDGQEAIQALEDHRIDFIISDVRMPNCDGVDLMKHVKAKYNFIPQIVLVSAFSQISRDEVKAIGGIDLLTKPSEIDELIELIKKHTNCE